MSIQSIWPRDCFNIDPPEALAPNEYTCFLIAPFTPEETFQELTEAVRSAIDIVRQTARFEMKLRTANDADQTRPIHPQIWAWIKHADIIVADVTGHNGNVMLELGVASAWRELRNVIIVQEEKQQGGTQERILFDVQPIKHILYRRSWLRVPGFINDMARAMRNVLISAPFDIAPGPKADPPLDIRFGESRDSKFVGSPPLGHRRPLADCLEFGSFYDFGSSWLDIGRLSLKNVRVNTEMRFTQLLESPSETPFIGVGIRSQWFYPALQYLLFLRTDGKCMVTLPPEGRHKPEDRDNLLGQIPSFNASDSAFVEFSIKMDDRELVARIADIEKVFRVDQIPHVFGHGRVLMHACCARAGVQRVSVEALD